MTHDADAKPLGEFDLIARHLKPLADPEGLGLLDDAAILSPPTGMDLVVTTDTLIAGVHFLAETGAEDIACKAMGANLSDLASMGAKAEWYTLNLAFSAEGPDRENWLSGFVAGLGALQKRYGLSLVGGDTTKGPGPLCITMTAFGLVPTGTALKRSGAMPGDDLYVTGVIGDAYLGLLGLSEGEGPSAPEMIKAYLRPEPRLALGQALRGIASSMADVSDGLMADLGHIAKASNVGLQVLADSIPISSGSKIWAQESPEDFAVRLEALITGGDDYELIFTAAPNRAEKVLIAADQAKTPVTRIGRVVDDGAIGVRLLDAEGRAVALTGPGGYRHF